MPSKRCLQKISFSSTYQKYNAKNIFANTGLITDTKKHAVSGTITITLGADSNANMTQSTNADKNNLRPVLGYNR